MRLLREHQAGASRGPRRAALSLWARVEACVPDLVGVVEMPNSSAEREQPSGPPKIGLPPDLSLVHFLGCLSRRELSMMTWVCN